MAMMTKPKNYSRAFSYRILTPDAQEWYNEWLKSEFVRFAEWTRKHKDDSRGFSYWWRWYGPTNFYTHDDSERFRRELFAYIVGKLDQIREDTAHEQQQQPVADTEHSG